MSQIEKYKKLVEEKRAEEKRFDEKCAPIILQQCGEKPSVLKNETLYDAWLSCKYEIRQKMEKRFALF